MQNFTLAVLMTALISSAWSEDAATLAARARGAYARIPHRMAPLSPEELTLAPQQAQQLVQLLILLDAAVVARVECTEQLMRRSTSAYSLYEGRVAQIEMELGPLKQSTFATAVTLTLEALADQKAYLQEWSLKPGGSVVASHPKVRSASGKLHQAYSACLKPLSKPPVGVTNAVFDRFCALDFI
jgi:hypothetical protein